MLVIWELMGRKEKSTYRNPPASVSQVLGLKTYPTIPNPVTFWDTRSHLTWSSLIWPDWLASKLPGSYLCPSQHLDYRYALAHLGFIYVLGTELRSSPYQWSLCVSECGYAHRAVDTQGGQGHLVPLELKSQWHQIQVLCILNYWTTPLPHFDLK